MHAIRHAVLPPPLVAEPQLAERGLKRWLHLGQVTPDPDLASFIRSGGAGDHDLLGALFSGSPFLAEVLGAEPGVLRLLREQGPDRALGVLSAELG